MPKPPRKQAARASLADEKNSRTQRRVTIRDVATAAGVSSMTVSNVINDVENVVREDTRRRVLKAIADLNYRPTSSGRNLRLGRRHAIGVVIVDEEADFLASPFITRLVSGVCSVLNDNGYVMIVQGIHPDKFASAFMMRRAEADAYCVRLNGPEDKRAEMLNVLSRVSEPIILIQETLSFPGEDHCTVRQDDAGGTQLVADHLLARGVETIVAMVPRHGGPMTGARLAGLREGLKRAPRPIKLDVVAAAANTFSASFDAMDAHIARHGHPRAVMGINDELALGALRAVQSRGLSVPEDVMVTGFNGFNPASYADPSLTTVVSPASELGTRSAQLLLKRLSGERFESAEVVLPVSFRKGNSTP